MRGYGQAYDGSLEQHLEMRRVLNEPRAATGLPQGWSFAVLENWRFAGPPRPPGFFRRNARLWRGRDGGLLGFSISYYGDFRAHIHTLSSGRGAEPEMLYWLEEVWARGKPELRTAAYRHDDSRRRLLAGRGFSLLRPFACTYRFDLGRPLPESAPPEGYSIESVAEHGAVEQITPLEHLVLGDGLPNQEEWHQGKSPAPGHSPDLYLHALAPGGQLVALVHGWADLDAGVGELDPVGTHPEHRRRGLATAAVVECFRRMRDLGVRAVYVAGEPEPDQANRFYESLGPSGKYYNDWWVKRLR